MNECIVRRFIENLPSVDKAYAAAFAEGMVKYCGSYRAYRDESINCEVDADYLAERSFIAVIPDGEFWIYSPRFIKTVAEAIEQLFKTSIVGLWVDYTSITLFKTYFVDKPGNRWGVSFVHDEESTKIYATMPRFETLYAMTRQLTDEEMNQQGRNATRTMIANDISAWRRAR